MGLAIGILRRYSSCKRDWKADPHPYSKRWKAEIHHSARNHYEINSWPFRFCAQFLKPTKQPSYFRRRISLVFFFLHKPSNILENITLLVLIFIYSRSEGEPLIRSTNSQIFSVPTEAKLYSNPFKLGESRLIGRLKFCCTRPVELFPSGNGGPSQPRASFEHFGGSLI